MTNTNVCSIITNMIGKSLSYDRRPIQNHTNGVGAPLIGQALIHRTDKPLGYIKSFSVLQVKHFQAVQL